MNEKKHICFVSLDYPSKQSGGGVGNQVRILGLQLVKKGYTVTVIALAQNGLPDFDSDHNMQVYRIHSANLHWYISKLPFFRSFLTLFIRELEYGWAIYQRILKIDQRQKISLIECTESGGFWLACLLRKIPLVVRLHGEQFTLDKYILNAPLSSLVKFSRILQRYVFKRAQLLISPSYAHGDEISHELGIKCLPMKVIHNGINVDSQQNMDRLNTLGLKKPQVLFVGRLSIQKGIKLFVKAAAKVVKEKKDVSFVLIGAEHPSYSKDALKRLIDTLGLGKYISQAGHVPADEVNDWYKRAEMCVISSYYESFGVVALEAMAQGVPVIASDVGGVPEIIEDGKNGLLFRAGDVDALAGAILQLLNNKEVSKKLGVAGYKHVRDSFDTNKLIDETINSYSEIISEHAKII